MKTTEAVSEIQLRFRRFHRSMEAKRYPDAVGEFQRLVKWLEPTALNVRVDMLMELYPIWLDVMWRAGMENQMLPAMDDYLQIVPDDEDMRVWRAVILFHTCHFDEARRELEFFRQEEWEDARVPIYLAALAERDDDYEQAGRFYMEVSELEEDFSPPVSIDEAEARAHFESAVESMPKLFQEAVARMPVEVKDLPSDKLLESADPARNPLMLGYLVAPPLNPENPIAPNIVLYSRNIGRYVAKPKILRAEFRDTLLYEIGTYLGMSEEEMGFTEERETGQGTLWN